MAKKHDERKDLECVSKVAKINGYRVIVPTDAVVGIHTWGRIDFLIHYCGYILYRAKNVKAGNLNFEDASVSAREAKKIKKEHKLKNKKK